MKLKAVLTIVIIITAAIGGALFIRFSNDHKECDNTVKQITDANGNIVTVKEHICKEKFNI